MTLHDPISDEALMTLLSWERDIERRMEERRARLQTGDAEYEADRRRLERRKAA